MTEEWKEGGMWGRKEAGRERGSNLHMSVSPQRTPLGDTFRKAYMTAIWQRGPLALFTVAYRLLRKWDEVTITHAVES